MIVRAVVISSMVAALWVPVSASADDPSPLCVPMPLDTIGAHAEVGDEEVHVPAISDAELCAVVWPQTGESTPTQFTVHTGCGFPCFTLLVESGDWTVVTTRAAVYLNYKTDGAPTSVPLADVPIGVHVVNPNPVCVAAGNPIPECPSGSIAVPVPAPVP